MSDPTRFDLDDRQRAILAEMGVRVWWPQRSDAAAPALATEPQPKTLPEAQTVPPVPAQPVARLAPVAEPRPAVVPSAPIAPIAPTVARAGGQTAQGPQAAAREPLPEGLAQMDWPALQEAVGRCGACALCATRKAPILGTGHAQTSWMVVGELPSAEDDQVGQPFTGQEGQLLDNMLKAVGVRRQSVAPQADDAALAQAYLTHAVKCRPPAGRNPESDELALCSGYLSRQVALVQPRVILAMGRFAIQTLLGSTEPIGKLRGRLHDFQGVPVVVTYPPSSLLRSPGDKAKAWADLVLALKVVKG